MDLLGIVQSIHHESKLPGSPPASVTGLSGRSADLVRWAIEAWNDIQRSKDGHWKWMRAEFTLDTVADKSSYVFGDCKDVVLNTAITRFRAWDMDPDDPPFIYLVSDGQDTEKALNIADWPRFRIAYVRGTHDSSEPSSITVDPLDNLFLGPTPDGIYKVTGYYWRSNQVLVDADDVPEMPSDYHMLIVYRAMVKYAYSIVARETLARARSEGRMINDALSKNQWYGRFSLRIADALA